MGSGLVLRQTPSWQDPHCPRKRRERGVGARLLGELCFRCPVRPQPSPPPCPRHPLPGGPAQTAACAPGAAASPWVPGSLGPPRATAFLQACGCTHGGSAGGRRGRGLTLSSPSLSLSHCGGEREGVSQSPTAPHMQAGRASGVTGVGGRSVGGWAWGGGVLGHTGRPGSERHRSRVSVGPGRQKRDQGARPAGRCARPGQTRPASPAPLRAQGRPWGGRGGERQGVRAPGEDEGWASGGQQGGRLECPPHTPHMQSRKVSAHRFR